MRKFRNIFFVAARPATRRPAGLLAGLLALLAVAGCSWKVDSGYDPDVALSFLPSVGKPGGESQSVPSEGSFGLSLWQNSIADQLDSEPVQLAHMSELEWKDGSWTLPSQPLWPSKGYGLKALAYSPCDKATACNLTDGVVFGDHDASLSPTLDLLYTKTILAENKIVSGGAVSLPFHHALTELSFRFIAFDSSISIRVREIRIPSVFVRGSFHSLPKPEWSFSGAASELRYEHLTEFLGTTPIAIPSVYLAPQDLKGGLIIRLSYIDPLDIEREMVVRTEDLNIVLNEDRQYQFTISLSPNSAKVIETGISQQNES